MNILITGTSSGIGKAIAEKFLDEGHIVYGIDKRESAIDNKYVNYTHYKQDVVDEKYPEIDNLNILINNAGIQEGDVINVNLKAVINITEHYINENIKSIVFIASSSATTGSEFPEYVASKGGVVAYMKNVALRIAQYGATANSISPGGVITPLNKHILDSEDLYEKVLNETLLNKWATAEEIAEFTYFISVVNKSMTGEDLFIDNGEKLKSNFIW